MGKESVITITSTSQWKKAVLNKKTRHQLVVVDFVASWCPPCRVMAPIVRQLAQDYPDVCIIKVDVDEHRAIATGCGIQQMPTFQLYFEGELVNSLLGADKDRLEAAIQELLDKKGTQQPQQEDTQVKTTSCFGGLLRKMFRMGGST